MNEEQFNQIVQLLEGITTASRSTPSEQADLSAKLEKAISELTKDRSQVDNMLRSFSRAASDEDTVKAGQGLVKVVKVLEDFIKATKKESAPVKRITLGAQRQQDPRTIDKGLLESKVSTSAISKYIAPLRSIIIDINKQFEAISREAEQARRRREQLTQPLFSPADIKKLEEKGIFALEEDIPKKIFGAYKDINQLQKLSWERIGSIAERAKKDYLSAPNIKEIEVAAKDSAKKISSSLLDASVAWRQLEKSGELTAKQLGVLKSGTEAITPTTLMAPVARFGAQRGYHSKYLNMPLGTFMHMQMTAETFRKGYTGPKTEEFLNAERRLGLEKDPILARQAAIVASGLHDLSKYELNIGEFKYVADHAFKAAEVMQSKFGQELEEAFGKDYAEQVIEAIRLHHLRPEHIDKFIERQVELGKEALGEEVDSSKLAMPDLTSKIGEIWQESLSKMDLTQLEKMKERLDTSLVVVMRAADGMMAGLVESMPDPDTFFDVMEASSIFSSEQREKISKLSTENKKQLQKYLMSRLSYGDVALDPQSNLEEAMKEIGQTFPMLIEDMSSKLLKNWGDLIEAKKGQLTEIGIPTHQLQGQLTQMGEALHKISTQPVELAKKHPQYQAAEQLGITYYAGRPLSQLDPTQQFIRVLGDISSLTSTEFGAGKPFTNLKQNLMEEFNAIVASPGMEGVREDLIKAFIIDPNIFRPFLASLRDENEKEVVRAMETKFRKFYDQAIQAVEEGGLINPFELMTYISQKSSSRIGAAPIYSFNKDVARVGAPRLGEEETLTALGISTKSRMTEVLTHLKEINDIKEKFLKLLSFEGFESEKFPKYQELFQTFFAEITGAESGETVKVLIDQHRLLAESLISEAKVAKALSEDLTLVNQGLDKLGVAELEQLGTRFRGLKAESAISRFSELEGEVPGLGNIKPEELQFIEQTYKDLSTTIGEYTIQQVQMSKVMEGMIPLIKEEIKAKESQIKASQTLLDTQRKAELAEEQRYKDQLGTKLEVLRSRPVLSRYEELQEGSHGWAPSTLEFERAKEIFTNLSTTSGDYTAEQIKLGEVMANLLPILKEEIRQREAELKVVGEVGKRSTVEQWETKERLARARGILEQYNRYQEEPGPPITLLEEENLAFLRRTIQDLSYATEEYTVEQINSSKLMDKMTRVMREENKHRYDNIRSREKEIATELKLQNERARAKNKADREFYRTNLGMGGRSGRGGGSGRGGVYGQGGLPFFMGGGGQAGWVMRQLAWQVAGPVIGSASFYNMVKKATEAVKEQEVAVINLRRVFGGTEADVEKLGGNITKMAIQFGSVVSQVGEIQEMWAKTGKDTAVQVEELTRVALLAINTADIDKADDAVRFLNSSIQQMGLDWRDAERLLDSWNKTADKFPAATKDFAEGYARAGSYAKMLNMDIHELNAVISLLVERTGRGGAEVGTALRMIFSNIHRPQTIKTLQSFDIDPYEAGSRTQFRDVMDLMDDVATKYRELELAEASASQVVLASALGQARRRNFAIALLDAWGSLDEVIEASTDSIGYSAKKMELSMESLAFKGRQLQASFQEAAVSMGQAGLVDILKGIIHIGNAGLEFFNSLAPSWRDGVTWLLLLNAALSTFNVIFKQTTGMSVAARAASGIAGIFGSPDKLEQMTAKRAKEMFGSHQELFKRDIASQVFNVDVAGGSQKFKTLVSKAVTDFKALKVAEDNLSKIQWSVIEGSEAAAKAAVDQARESYNTTVQLVNEAAATEALAKARRTAALAAQIGITLVLAGIAALIAYKKNQEERRKQIEEEIRQYREQTTSVKALISRYEELSQRQREAVAQELRSVDTGNTLNRVQGEMNELYVEFARVMPKAVNGVDEFGNKIATNIDLVRRFNSEMEKAIKNQLIIAGRAAAGELPGVVEEKGKVKEDLDAIGEALDTARKSWPYTKDPYKGHEEIEIPYSVYWALNPKAKERELLTLATIEGIRGAYAEEVLAERYSGSYTMDLKTFFDLTSKEYDVILSKYQELNDKELELRGAIDEGLRVQVGVPEALVATTEKAKKYIGQLEAFTADTTENVQENAESLNNALDLVLKGRAKGKTDTDSYKEAFDYITSMAQEAEHLRLRLSGEWDQMTEEAQNAALASVDISTYSEDQLRELFENYHEDYSEERARYFQAIKQEHGDFVAELSDDILEAESQLKGLEEYLASSLPDLSQEEIDLKEMEITTLKNIIEGLKKDRATYKFALGAAVGAIAEIPTTYTPSSSGASTGNQYKALDKLLKTTDKKLKAIEHTVSILDEVWKFSPDTGDRADSVKYLTSKLGELHNKEIELIRAHKETGVELEKLRKRSGDHSDKVAELEARYQDLEKQIKANKNAMHELSKQMDEIDTKLYEKRIADIDERMTDLDITLKILAGGLKVGEESFEYATLELNKFAGGMDLLANKEHEQRVEIDRLILSVAKYKEQLESATDEQSRVQAKSAWEGANEQLKKAYRTFQEINVARLDLEKGFRDFVTQTVTTGYDKALKEEIELIEAKDKAAKEAHDNWVKARRRELELMKRQWATEDYDKDMQKLRDEEAHLWEQYYRIEQDQSAWAEKRRAEIMHEIREKQREIEGKAEDRKREKQTETIEDEIEQREDAFSEAEKIREEERTEVEKHYEKLKDNAEARIQGIYQAWVKHKGDLISLLKSIIPEFGLIGADYQKELMEGFKEGEAYFVENKPSSKGATGSLPTSSTYSIFPGSGEGDYTIINGRAYMHSRALGELIGKYVDFKDGKAVIGGKSYTDQIWMDKGLYLPIAKVAKDFGWNVTWAGSGLPVTLSRYQRGGVSDYEGLHYLHKREMVLPEKYTDVMDYLSDFIKMPKAIIPDLSRLQANINNNIDVREAIHIAEAHFSDEVDLQALESQAGAQLKRSLRRKGIRLS